MSITNGPKPQNMVRLESVRAQLQERAELAADANGMVDTSKVSGETAELLKVLGGGSKFELATLKKALDGAMNRIDSADTGGKNPLYFGYQGNPGVEMGAMERRAETKQRDISNSPIMARLKYMTGGGGNMTLESSERAKLESTKDPAAAAVLAVADSGSEAGAKALAAKHFTGGQVLHRDYWDVPDPKKPHDTIREYTGFVRGEPGALRDVESVMVKHQKSGKWFTAPVKADGSYEIPLGKNEGELSVWYQAKGGDRFMGGRVMLFNNTHTDDLGRGGATSSFDIASPLRFAPKPTTPLS